MNYLLFLIVFICIHGIAIGSYYAKYDKWKNAFLATLFSCMASTFIALVIKVLMDRGVI